MSDMIVLSGSEVEMVAGGQVVGNITVQNNVNVNPQVAIGVAVLSPFSPVNANNNSSTVQLNVVASA